MSKPIDWTKPLRTVQWHYPARVICTDRDFGRYPIVLLVKDSGNEKLCCANLEGSGNIYDVENAPETKKFRTYFYKNGRLILSVSEAALEDDYERAKKDSVRLGTFLKEIEVEVEL